jgi:hypothetical protein
MTDRRRAAADTHTARVLAELVTRLDALEGTRLEQRVETLERLVLKLRDEKLDKTAVADQVLELIRRVHR